MNSGFTSIAKYVFDWETRFYQAQRLAQLNGIAGRDTDPLNPRNSIEHAYTSATLQKELGGFSAIPEVLGNALEVDATSRYLLGGDDNRADSFRDLWNNAIGRQIGDYVRQNDLSQGDLEDLLIQAYNRGDLIPVQTDPRVPPNFSGWPGEFEQTQQPSWGGPSPGWTPSGGPGAVGDLQPPASGWPPPSDPDSPSDPSDASGPSDPSAPFSPNHPNPLQSRDPLVLDLNGNGIELTDVRSSNAHFDYGGTGFAVHTGWFAPTEGILIRDIDHNSSVTADELFGAVSGNALDDLAAKRCHRNPKKRIPASQIIIPLVAFVVTLAISTKSAVALPPSHSIWSLDAAGFLATEPAASAPGADAIVIRFAMPKSVANFSQPR